MADSERYQCQSCGRFCEEPSQGTRGECPGCGASTVRMIVVGQRKRRDARRRSKAHEPSSMMVDLVSATDALAAATAARDGLVVSLRRSGESLRSIGRAAGLTAPGVLYILDRAGVTRDAALADVGEAF